MTRVSSLSPQPSDRVRLGIAFAFALGLAAYVVYSWHWPLMWDMQVMHYVSFLMDHGWAPYRQIGDMNMPGAYMVEHGALQIFGHTDLGWRWWDFLLSAALTGGMLAIAGPYDWLAGVLGAGTFILTHAAEGPKVAGQRDQVLAVLLVVATAILFEAVRRRQPLLFYVCGFLAAFAAAIKPTVVMMGPLLLLLAWRELVRRHEPWRAALGWGLAGFASAFVLVLHFLLHWQALEAFLRLTREVLPHYAASPQATWAEMLRLSMPIPLFVFTAGAVMAYVFTRDCRRSWEETALLLGVLVGALSFFGQRKGFAQHRYTMLAFLLLWDSLQIARAMRAPSRFPRRVAWLATTVVLLYGARMVWQCRNQPRVDLFSSYLQADLDRLGPAALQHQVQCLDIVDGCMTALFHLDIVQSTGSTGDLLLFLPQDAPPVEHARAAFWRDITARPPEVYVVSNWQFGVRRHTFGKLNTWPAFQQYLVDHYVVAAQREFPPAGPVISVPGADPDVQAYRLYIRRESPLREKLAEASAAVPAAMRTADRTPAAYAKRIP